MATDVYTLTDNDFKQLCAAKLMNDRAFEEFIEMLSDSNDEEVVELASDWSKDYGMGVVFESVEIDPDGTFKWSVTINTALDRHLVAFLEQFFLWQKE